MMPPNATLLVIDDAPDTLSFIHDALTPEGFNCLLALDAEQGFHIAQKMFPDLILLDGILPTTSGFELCERCHNDKELVRTPIIFMTGLQDNESLAKALAAGCVDFVTKPINTTNLIARIRVHLASSRLIQRTQLALDQAGQHLFAVSPTGDVLWQTPEVQNLLSAHSATWLNTVFYPSLTHWVTHPDVPRLLRLQTEKSTFLQLEWLAGSCLNPYTEILGRTAQ